MAYFGYHPGGRMTLLHRASALAFSHVPKKSDLKLIQAPFQGEHVHASRRGLRYMADGGHLGGVPELPAHRHRS